MNCRVCHRSDFGSVIDLGAMPLVNNLLMHPDDECPTRPLQVVFCRHCSCSQLTDAPPPESMFTDYTYRSAQSQTMVLHAENLVKRHVSGGDQVLEIASNDGYLLRHAIASGATVLGVDPAANIAADANEAGIPTRCEFFNDAVAGSIANSWGQADVIFANNVLAHVPNPNEIAAGISRVLAPDGVAHIEVPYLIPLIENLAFDTIYHEHQCYFTVSSLLRLFNAHGLRLTNIELIPIHGGSLHLQVRHAGDESMARVFVEQESDAGVCRDAFYADFARRVDVMKSELLSQLTSYDTVAAFGAAAKGIVLLNYFGLTTEDIPWVADVSPYKQGRFVPGMRQPIVSPDWLLEHAPDACLVLPWNLHDEIVTRNKAYSDAGGTFLSPMPLTEGVAA